MGQIKATTPAPHDKKIPVAQRTDVRERNPQVLEHEIGYSDQTQTQDTRIAMPTIAERGHATLHNGISIINAMTDDVLGQHPDKASVARVVSKVSRNNHGQVR